MQITSRWLIGFKIASTITRQISPRMVIHCLVADGSNFTIQVASQNLKAGSNRRSLFVRRWATTKFCWNSEAATSSANRGESEVFNREHCRCQPFNNEPIR